MEFRDGCRRTDTDSLKYTDLPVGSELRPSQLTCAKSRLSTRKSIYYAIPHPLSPSVQLTAGKLFPGGCRHLRVPECGVSMTALPDCSSEFRQPYLNLP